MLLLQVCKDATLGSVLFGEHTHTPFATANTLAFVHKGGETSSASDLPYIKWVKALSNQSNDTLLE